MPHSVLEIYLSHVKNEFFSGGNGPAWTFPAVGRTSHPLSEVKELSRVEISL